MPLPKELLVLPNPDCSLDHTGEPQGAVQLARADGAIFLDAWVGARVDAERTKKEGRFVFVFDRETPVRVATIDYYLRKLQEGSLLPADQATADAAGVPWTPPEPAPEPKTSAPKAAKPKTSATPDEDAAKPAPAG